MEIRPQSGMAKLRPDIDGDLVAHVVDELKTIARSATLAFTLKVGEIVFLRIYRGDKGLLRRQRGKYASFRRLAAHPGLPFSAATLWRAVAIYELVQRLPERTATTHLGVAHLRSVLGLAPDVQERLLREAEQGRWTKEEIEERAAEWRAAAPRRGRPRSPPALKMFTVAERVARRMSGSLGHDAVVRLDAAEAARAEGAVRWLRELCDQVEQALRARTEQLAPGGAADAVAPPNR
jgi:hypothetical protein